MNYQIFPIGDGALTIDFGNKISEDLNNRALKLARAFDQNSFEGFMEAVPAYSSLTIFYDVYKVRKSFPAFLTAFEKVNDFVENELSKLDDFSDETRRLLEIPVCFETEFALDLEFIASENGLSSEKAIEIFLSRNYRVFMLGFLPGFSYMGELDERIVTPRKFSPRLKVPAGSVGIAGKQTGIYSLESPGGWQIIGQTPLKLFTPEKEHPTLFQAGDTVKFYKIDLKTFKEINQ